MSQNGSSIAGDNPELKYKKALMQIQKIHNANKVLKNQSEQMRDQYERQISQLNNMLQEHQKEYEALKQDKADIQKYYDELQISHSELRKEYTSLQREYAYLNDVLTEQNNELKKVNAFKDQKGLTNLINSYEDKEINYRKDISRLEQNIKNLKSNYEAIENDLAEQKRQRFKLEDLNNNLRMQISKYRQLNNNLINKNQNIVATLLNRSSEGKEKYREAETMLRELSKQLEVIKNTKIEQATLNKATVSMQSYQNVLNDKSKLQAEVLKLRQKLSEYDSKAISNFEMEQKMKKALLHAQQLQEQCNMLKGKLILVQTKDAMDGSTEFGDLKDLQEKILAGISQNDPLVSIKNSSDSSHFQLMKSYIIELKQKLSKAMVEKKEVEKKYRSLKEKLTDKAQKAISYEEQNKLLKGKLEGFQRLTQRLQFELERTIEAHEEQLAKMKNVTNNIINKKTEEVKMANAYVRAQLDLQLDKFQKTQKSLRQEVETLKLEISTQKLKNVDLQQKYTQANEFLQIYQKKFNELTASSLVVEQDNQNLEENVSKYQQLYREQRNKNEALLLQKQALNLKLAEISQQYENRKYGQQQLAKRFSEIEAENKKTKSELAQAKNQIQNLQNILKISKKQFEDKSRIAMLDISRTQSSYYIALQQNFNQQKQRNKQLQTELQQLKFRLERALQQSQKVVNLEDALNSKNDQINDFKRKNIITEKQISLKEAELKQAKNQTDILRRQNNALKVKLLQNGQQLRKSYEFKDFEGKKITQKLNEQLSSAISELREERRISARMQSDIQSYRSEIQRLQNIIDEAKNKEMNLYEQASQLRSSLQNAGEQRQRDRKQITFKNGLIDNLNNQIIGLQQKLFNINQENSQNKMKFKQVENELSQLKRQINGIKIYLKEVEDYGNTKVASGSWQEQRDRENIANFAQRIKKILKKVEISQSTGQYRSANILSTTQSPVPNYLRSYNQPLLGANETRRTSMFNSPIPISYGGENHYTYGDYN